MTIQEIYLRKYPVFNIPFEELTQKDINDICNSVHYHVFALSFHVKVAVKLITDQVFNFAAWLDSGIRASLRN